MLYHNHNGSPISDSIQRHVSDYTISREMDYGRKWNDKSISQTKDLTWQWNGPPPFIGLKGRLGKDQDGLLGGIQCREI